MFPLIPFLCIAAMSGGAGVLVWYESKSDEEKEKANKMTADLAMRLFQKSVKNLTRDQADLVASMVQKSLDA